MRVVLPDVPMIEQVEHFRDSRQSHSPRQSEILGHAEIETMQRLTRQRVARDHVARRERGRAVESILDRGGNAHRSADKAENTSVAEGVGSADRRAVVVARPEEVRARD